jgi:hypothetical protein
MRNRGTLVLTLAVALLGSACATGRRVPKPRAQPPPPPPGRTVEDVLDEIGGPVEPRLRARFRKAGLGWPPARVHLIALKQEAKLELWADGSGGRKLVHVYPILAASGTVGPKLRQGDEQVPEGIYQVTWLHPNSDYHLSMKLDYPNRFDREKGRADGRADLGGDIFIHGSDVSIGCLAMGNPAIEELFVLAAKVRPKSVRVIITPWDLRLKAPPKTTPNGVDWLPELYRRLRAALAPFS